MKIKVVHCLFEQSGTFRDVFRNKGYEAYCYDIENKFNETDYQIDLFNEIEKGYLKEKSIFDNMNENDLIFAFFPCTWFSVQNDLIWSRTSYNFKTWNEKKIDEYIAKREREREYVYNLLLKFIKIIKRKKIKTVIENPYTNNYLLTQKEIKQPNIIIMNRRDLSDHYIKPTMFYFYNLKPTYFANHTIVKKHDLKTVSKTHGIDRSLISPEFAYNFINKYVLGK